MTRRWLAVVLAGLFVGAVAYIAVGGSSSKAPRVGRIGSPRRLFGAHGSGPVVGTSPTNTALPTISGTTVEFHVLTATTGTWERASSFSYQWEDCNSSGAECSPISFGATESTYTLKHSDVGHKLRVVVTGHNTLGTGSAMSEATAIVTEEGESFTCSHTLKSTQTATEDDNVLKEAVGGETICLESGTYPVELALLKTKGEGEGRSSYVTIRPAPGATPILQKVQVRDTGYERWEHLTFTVGFQVEDNAGHPGTHDIQILHNNFEEPLYGVDLKGGGSQLIHKVAIEYNYMHHVKIENHETCKAGVATGQDVTNAGVEGVTIAHNTFNEAEWHYIQGGSSGPAGVNVEHNLFMGHEHDWTTCKPHLNVWQIFAFAENDVFKYNVVVGQGTGVINAETGERELASADMFEYELGAADKGCTADEILKSTIEDNLFINGGGNSQLWEVHGAVVSHNTIVYMKPESFGVGLEDGTCAPAKEITFTHNIGSEAPLAAGTKNEGLVWDFNATTDKTANQFGSTHSQQEWVQKWKNTTWNVFKEVNEEGKHFPDPPAGFYIPEGVTVEGGAGYEEGTVGP